MMRHLYNKIIHCVMLGLSCVLFCTASFSLPNQEGIQVYQKNLHLSPERKQSLADDIDRYHNADNIWDVLRQEFVLDHYENNVLVQEQIEWFMSHQDFLYRSITRAAPYLYYIMQQAHKRNLPAEVVLLPVFESSYDPFAYSPQGAAGIWQMMPDTASGYGIKHNRWYDGRRDVIASTKAALNYLSYLGSFFDNNWLLAIAAYDTGEGNVLGAIRRNIRDGGSTDYWSLPLSQETRIYVPRLLALATIIAHPETYPVYLPPVRNAPYLAQMDVGSQIALKHAANLAGLTMKRIMQLNPGYNRAITDPNVSAKLVLPIENVEQFSENLARLPLYLRVNRDHYHVKPGDSLASISKQFNTTPKELRKLNQLASGSITEGDVLQVPEPAPDLSKQIMDSPPQPAAVSDDYVPPVKHSKYKLLNPSMTQLEVALQNMNGHYTLQPGDTIYMAREGDSVERVAMHFHTSVLALRLANNLGGNATLQAGTKLIVPTHVTNSQYASVDNSQYQNSAGDTIYTVRSGETMAMIARRFHTTPPAIRIVNLLASDDLHDGDKLLIPAHV